MLAAIAELRNSPTGSGTVFEYPVTNCIARPRSRGGQAPPGTWSTGQGRWRPRRTFLLSRFREHTHLRKIEVVEQR